MENTRNHWAFHDAAHRRLRVLLLTSDDPQHAYVRRLLAARLDLVGTVVEPGAAQKRRLWTRRRYYDLAFRVYQGRRQRITGRARWRSAYFARLSAELPRSTSVIHRVDSVNSAAARELVTTLAPDLTVVCGTGVLGRRIIEQNPGLMVNIHGGWLPEYKGNHGVYFAYLNRDWSRIGATVHMVSPTLDAGPVFAQVAPELQPGDDDEKLYSRSVHQAALLLTELALDLEEGAVLTAAAQPDRGTTYRHRDRTPVAEFRLWLRRLRRQHLVPPRAGRTITFSPEGTAGPRSRQRPRAVGLGTEGPQQPTAGVRGHPDAAGS
ncbi:formyl transferase [Streptomyces sp. NPDC020800]|uniref:formyl transferase n=1 Tax=Streptomyces sp. NPDC020800 TaxID=3365092 RepID=UPI00379CEB60